MSPNGPGKVGDRLLWSVLLFLAAAIGIRVGVELVYSVMWQILGLLALSGVVFAVLLRGRRDRW